MTYKHFREIVYTNSGVVEPLPFGGHDEIDRRYKCFVMGREVRTWWNRGCEGVAS